MAKRKARKDLKAILPCIECGKGLEMNVFEVPLPYRKKISSGYGAGKDWGLKEVKCGSCGTRQEIMLQAIATKIS